MDSYTKIFSPNCFSVNQQIIEKYLQLGDDDFKEKTHLFHGRYENIYLDVRKISELEVVVNIALEHAASILNVSKEKIVSGFWLNEMKEGDVTTAHTHDDDDELLSCVYYVKVPKNSGNLIITEKTKKITITPKDGEFIFFSPSTLHEVSENKSGGSRLSIAFNFGLLKE